MYSRVPGIDGEDARVVLATFIGYSEDDPKFTFGLSRHARTL